MTKLDDEYMQALRLYMQALRLEKDAKQDTFHSIANTLKFNPNNLKSGEADVVFGLVELKSRMGDFDFQIVLRDIVKGLNNGK